MEECYKTMWLILYSKVLDDSIKYRTNIIDKDGYSFKEILDILKEIKENNQI